MNNDAPLKLLYQQLRSKSLLTLFDEHPQRVQDLQWQVGGLQFDYSKNHLTPELLQQLCKLAETKEMAPAIAALLNGEPVNNTEHRPAHHSALRDLGTHSKRHQAIWATLDKMEHFADTIHKQQWLGFNGSAVDTIVNIGIGGSDLGPRMVTQALTAYHHAKVNVHFVANIDGADLSDTLASLNPATTLFVIASKSFSTLETLNNALSARQWMLDAGCSQQQLAQHFVAISSNTAAASNFGIAEDNIFPIWDWVGGRYSLWSAIGLPIVLAIGMSHFRQLLAGAQVMDQHVRQAPLQANVPVIAALLSYWYSHYWGATSQAVLPYAQRLCRLPAYLQQLDMESLGKRVNKAGETITHTSGLVVWGTEGTNGQHSFHQLLHQGTQLIPVDFIAINKPMSGYHDQHRHLLACCISQSQALLQGKTLAQAQEELRDQGLSEEELSLLAPHKVIPGNKPSTTIIMDELCPKTLGSLLAFYEHKVYASSVLLGINAFDQWGVELGKQLGKPIYAALSTGESDSGWDQSTRSLVEKLQ